MSVGVNGAAYVLFRPSGQAFARAFCDFLEPAIADPEGPGIWL